MALFLSTYVNKVDRKGRVSVPAAFRATLQGQSYHGIVAYPSFKHEAIEASGVDRLLAIQAQLDTLEPLSEEHENLQSLFADSRELAFDSEGRIALPENFIAYAQIEESAAFVGAGNTFQIWEPARHAAYQATVRERRQRATLPPLNRHP